MDEFVFEQLALGIDVRMLAQKYIRFRVERRVSPLLLQYEPMCNSVPYIIEPLQLLGKRIEKFIVLICMR